MLCAENCYFHMRQVDSCCQIGITMLFSSLYKYKLSEPWGHWHLWLSLPASPGASHHSAHGPGPRFSPADSHPQADVLVWPRMLGVPPAASRLPWSLLGWWDGLWLARPCPATLWGAPSLPALGSSQSSPDTNTSTRCEVVEHQTHQLEMQVLCECLLGTNRVAREWAWVELVFLWSLMGGGRHCPFCSSMETQVFVSIRKYYTI